MKKKLPILFILLTALTILIQAAGLEVFAASGDKYIATGNVNLRSGPSTKYSKIDYILKNKEVELISQYNLAWNKVKYNGKIGYASSKYLKPTSTGTTTQAYVTTAGVNFRTGPSTKYSSNGVVSKGTTVQLISISNNWAKVIYKGKTGYMHAAYISPKAESTTPPDSTSTQEYTTTAGVNFRTGPSTKYSSNGVVSKGTTVQLISISNNWAKVIYKGKTGYMHAAYVSPKTENTTPPDSTSTQAYITTAGVNFRTGPSTKYSSNGVVSKGSTVQLISISNNWAKVIYKGKTGYMHAAYIEFKADLTLGNKLNVDAMYSNIKTISTQYPNRMFGTVAAANASNYIANELNKLNYYNIEKEYSKAVNPLVGESLVDVINVVARPKNYDSKKKDVVFVAHYDTVANTPGANDNASGIAMLLELSRYFSHSNVNFNPIILACGGEEKGKPGTEDFIARNKNRLLNQTEVVINLDMVGRGNNYQIWNLNSTMQNKTYPQLAYKIGKQMGLQIELKRNSRGIADYKMFELINIPTITFMNITDENGKNVPYYHTSLDTIDTISKTTMRNISTMVMNMVEYINHNQ